MIKIEQHIPNFLTLLNLFCGFLGIFAAFNGELVFAAWLIFIGAVFDLADGLSARLLNAYSSLGKQLDSLADIVTFGVLPAAILHILLTRTQSPLIHDWYIGPVAVLSMLPFLLLACSALRLGKFNIDAGQSAGFTGLPTPANAMFWGSFPLILQYRFLVIRDEVFNLEPIIMNVYLLIILIPAFSWLLVSPLRMFSLKFKPGEWRNDPLRLGFIAASILLFVLFLFAAIPLIILLYIILSLISKSRDHEVQS